MGSVGIILNYALLYGAILLIGALSAYLCERVGIINIGIDGMMCFGAVFYGIFSSPKLGLVNMGDFGIVFAILLTMIATMIVGAMHAYATINLKSNHVISGAAINLIGLAFAAFINAPLGQTLYGTSRLESGFNDFLFIGNSIYGSSIIMFCLAILVAIVIYVVINKTKVGLRCIAIGENPGSVDSQGINVICYQWVVVLLSAALAGFAGGLFLFNIKIFQGNTQGLGYLALAILIIGAWKAEWIIVASIVFALFTSLSMSNILTNIGFPKELAYSMPYIITTIMLVFFSKWVRPPEHDGIPYDKNDR